MTILCGAPIGRTIHPTLAAMVSKLTANIIKSSLSTFFKANNVNGTKIISGSKDNTIKIWDANTEECLKTLAGHSDYVASVAYSPDGTKIISGSEDNTIKIWDANTGECLKTLEGHSFPVRSVAYSPDGTKIISGSLDYTIKIWGEE